jgi:hypothetical protein
MFVLAFFISLGFFLKKENLICIFFYASIFIKIIILVLAYFQVYFFCMYIWT